MYHQKKRQISVIYINEKMFTKIKQLFKIILKFQAYPAEQVEYLIIIFFL